MRRDFEITQGIYLEQPPYKLDLHNNFEFLGFDYSVEHRTLLLRWRRSRRKSVASGTPASLTIQFLTVSEFRFHPRDSAQPFTEDDCVSLVGYWTNEDWADGVIVAEPSQTPNPKWLSAIDFMSGAVLAVQAASAHARIEA